MLQQVAALHAMVGALHACRVFGLDNRGALTHKATGFSAKLLRKGDQCRAVLACAHLFWQAADGSSLADADDGGAADAKVRRPVPPTFINGPVCSAACARSGRRTCSSIVSRLAAPQCSGSAVGGLPKTCAVGHGVFLLQNHRPAPLVSRQAQPTAEPAEPGGKEPPEEASEEAPSAAEPAAPDGSVLQPPVRQ